MRVRTAVASTILAAGMTVPLAGVAVAQDRDCPDFGSRAEAQAAYDAAPGDPENLDADNDGIACETVENGPSDFDERQENADSDTRDRDRGTAPQGSVEAGAGGTAGGGSELLALIGLGGAALAAGGAGLVRRRMTGQGDRQGG